MRNDDQRIYRSFEEFEREELRRLETMGASVDDMIETLFGEDVTAGTSKRAEVSDDDE